MNDHISKPIDPGNLFETVGRFFKPASTAPPADATARDLPATAAPPPPAPAHPPVAPQPISQGLPVIPGLDTRDGLTRVAGNQKLYLKILRQFADQQGAAPAQIAEALTRDDRAAAERLAHTVKGVAGNLGAREIQQVAAGLEKDIAAKKSTAELMPPVRELETLLTDFVRRLRDALPAAPPAPAAGPPATIDPALTRRVVVEMLTHLRNFDAAAGDLLEAQGDVLRALLPAESFATFERHVGGFAFAEALAVLEPVAREKGIVSQ